jgi:hypothetical protein
LTADVTGADVAADVGFEEELAEGVNVSTRLRVLPVRTTQSLPAPPHLTLSVPPQVVSQVLLSIAQLEEGILSPHQQFTPSDKPMTSLFNCRHTNWQLPGLWKS